MLRQVATAAGLDPTRIERVLDSDDCAAEVRADEQAAQELEVTGVPHFLVNGRWAIPGAQDIETLVIILRRAWARTEAQPS